MTKYLKPKNDYRYKVCMNVVYQLPSAYKPKIAEFFNAYGNKLDKWQIKYP